MRILPDVNAIAIQLVDSHPGHPYVAGELNSALTGEADLLMFGYLPLRVQWVLDRKMDLDTVDARNAIQSLLRFPMEFVNPDADVLRDAYEISAEKNHGIYDCFYIALARAFAADAILTTDTDFEDLCEDEPFDYLNPVPEEVLARFDAVASES